MFIGTGGDNEFKIPSENFLSSIFQSLGIEDLSGRCMIQVNIRKNIEFMHVDAEDARGTHRGDNDVSPERCYSSGARTSRP